jgi:predicted site-specific integrase-resolvase
LTDLLDQKETASRLRLSANTLEKWRCQGSQKLPYIKPGGAVRYRASDVEQFIADNVVGGPAKRIAKQKRV